MYSGFILAKWDEKTILFSWLNSLFVRAVLFSAFFRLKAADTGTSNKHTHFTDKLWELMHRNLTPATHSTGHTNTLN